VYQVVIVPTNQPTNQPTKQTNKRADVPTHPLTRHLGSASRLQLPVYRGFDSSFGFLDGMEDHLNHRMTTCNTSGGTLTQPNDPDTNWGCWGNADPLDSCIDIDCYKNAPSSVSWDLWRNDAPANHSAYDMQFSQDMWEHEIISIISAHNASTPLFFYMPFQVRSCAGSRHAVARLARMSAHASSLAHITSLSFTISPTQHIALFFYIMGASVRRQS
jgi:hypothetical protein